MPNDADEMRSRALSHPEHHHPCSLVTGWLPQSPAFSHGRTEMLPHSPSAAPSSAGAEQRLQHRPLHAHRWNVAVALLCRMLGKHFAAFPQRHGGSLPPLCCIRQRGIQKLNLCPRWQLKYSCETHRGKKKKKKWEWENRNPSLHPCKQIALKQEHTYGSAASSLGATCPEAPLGAQVLSLGGDRSTR